MLEPRDPDWKPSTLADISVLVVDDDPMITTLVDVTLRAMGLSNIYTINDPQQALDFLAEGVGGVQLVICDLDMPDVSGFDVLEQVRQGFPKMPFLMLTANRSSDAVAQAAGKGVSGYMAKPFQQNELKEKVRRLIQRRYGQVPENNPFAQKT